MNWRRGSTLSPISVVNIRSASGRSSSGVRVRMRSISSTSNTAFDQPSRWGWVGRLFGDFDLPLLVAVVDRGGTCADMAAAELDYNAMREEHPEQRDLSVGQQFAYFVQEYRPAVSQ